MAGDWIPVRTDLPDDLAVIGIAGATGLDEDQVVGKLLRFWIWVDRHLQESNAPGVTLAFVDRCVNAPGFGQAMVNVGWLQSDGSSLVIPNFNRWFSQSGKRRLLTAQRAAKHRAKSNADRNAPSVTKCAPTEQNRTEQNRTEQESTEESSSTSKRSPRLASPPPPSTSSAQAPRPADRRDGAGRDDQKKAEGRKGGPDWEEARQRANLAIEKLGLEATRWQDRSLLLKACALVAAGKMPEHWLTDSIEAVLQTESGKPWAYFHTCLENKATEYGVELKPMLARLRVPAGLLKGKPERNGSDAN